MHMPTFKTTNKETILMAKVEFLLRSDCLHCKLPRDIYTLSNYSKGKFDVTLHYSMNKMKCNCTYFIGTNTRVVTWKNG